MSANSAFLSCVLRLQIRDRNFCGRGAFGARVVERTRKRGCISEFFALRRLQVSTGNIEGGRSGHGHSCTHRERVALVRTSRHRTGKSVTVVKREPSRSGGL